MLDPIEGLSAIGNVAFRADNRFMFSAEWITGFLMVLYGKCCWLESLFHVAAPAFTMVRSVGKLSIVGIRLMTIHTLGMRQRLPKIAGKMTFGAGDLGVHPS